MPPGEQCPALAPRMAEQGQNTASAQQAAEAHAQRPAASRAWEHGKQFRVAPHLTTYRWSDLCTMASHLPSWPPPCCLLPPLAAAAAGRRCCAAAGGTSNTAAAKWPPRRRTTPQRLLGSALSRCSCSRQAASERGGSERLLGSGATRQRQTAHCCPSAAGKGEAAGWLAQVLCRAYRMRANKRPCT